MLKKLLALLLMVVVCNGAVAANMVVTLLSDDLSNNGNCSLREAIRAANTNVQVDTCPAGSASAADVVVLQAKVSNNTSSTGGGIQLSAGALVAQGSTITSNAAIANTGGGIQVAAAASIALSDSTVSNNDAVSAGWINDGGTLTARNTVIANNLDASPSGSNVPDCSGTLVSGAFVLLGNNFGCGLSGGSVFINSDSGLLALAANGGPTLTHAFAAGARVHELGNPSGCRDHTGALITTDQRGTARARATRSDVGAVEFDNAMPTVVSVTRLDPSPTAAASVRFAVTFSEAVFGVDAPSDFALVQSGISNAATTDIAATNNRAVFAVTVSTGIGNGTLRLNVIDNNSIQDFALNDTVGGFAAGESYTIDRALGLFANGFLEPGRMQSADARARAVTPLYPRRENASC